MTDERAHDLLHCPMVENDAQAATVGEYLGLLLSTLWLQGPLFNGKRPFGNSNWQNKLYVSMILAGFVGGVVEEEDGHFYLEEFEEDDRFDADELILQAIRLAYTHE